MNGAALPGPGGSWGDPDKRECWDAGGGEAGLEEAAMEEAEVRGLRWALRVMERAREVLREYSYEWF